jgi:GDP-4-dehydro-6-deoxy-D-mannose reductase
MLPRPGAEDLLKALITGISGFVGSHLAEHILSHTDWQVAGTVYGPANNVRHIESQLELFPMELSDLGMVQGLLEKVSPDYIVHLAAQPLVSLSRMDPWGTLENNIRIQLNILEATARLKLSARVLVIGSSEEYGLVRADELPVKETNPLRPTSPYAVSKIAQDMLGLQYHLSRNLDVVRVRPFNHIGPRQSPGFVAPDFAQQIVKAETGLSDTVMQVGNLDGRVDFSDVRDVARAYQMLLVKGKSGDVYNVGSGQSHAVSELLQVLLSFSGTHIRIQKDPARYRPLDVPEVVADYGRLEQDTGWRPTIPFEQSLRDVLDYWRDRIGHPAHS